MSAVRPPPKNDYTPPAPLPGSLRRPAAPSASAAAVAAQASIDPAEYLEKAEGEWNERVDKEIGGLAGGLESLVKSFGVEPTQAGMQQHALPLASLSLGLLHAGLLKNAQNLLKITHDLKLLHLLAPTSADATSAANGAVGIAAADPDNQSAVIDVAGSKADTPKEAQPEQSLDALRAEVAALEKEWQRSSA